MSVESSALVWHHSQAPTATMKLILLKIADHDGDGGAWPSMDTLAAAGMCTRRNAQKAVRLLEELGEIRVHLNAGGGVRTAAHMRTNVYEVLLECPWYCDHSTQHRDLRDEQNKHHRPAYWGDLVSANDPVSPATPRVASDAPPVSPATPEPPYNHPTTKTSSVTDKNSTARETISTESDTPPTEEPWHPGLEVARAAEALAAAKAEAPGGVITATERDRYRQLHEQKRAPAPKPRPRALARSDTEHARIAELHTQPCPAMPSMKHWIPPTMTECARGCGLSIIEQEALI